MESEEFLAIAITSLLLLIVSSLYKKFPPKKINYLYGYRTHRSMANQKVWEVANEYSAEKLWQLALLLFASGVLLIVLNIPYAALIHAGILVAGLILSIILTERFLNKHFDKKGNPK